MEVTDYAGEFVICGKSPAAAMRVAVERMMERLRLPVDGEVNIDDARYEGESTRPLFALQRRTENQLATREPSDSPRPLGRPKVIGPFPTRVANVRQRPRT